MPKCIGVLPVLVCLAAGCATARTSHLRVIDAETGQPLPGVQGDRLAFMWQPAMPGLIPVAIPFPLESVTSDASGRVVFAEQGTDFAFQKEGYDRVQIAGTLRGFKIKHSDGLPYLALLQDGSVEVPLRKSTGSSFGFSATAPPPL